MTTSDALSSDLCRDFRRYLVEVRHFSPRTVAAYTRLAAALLAQAGDARSVAELDRKAIVSFLRLDRGKPTSKVGWNLRLTGVRALFRWLVEEGTVARNPTHGIERQHVESAEREPLSLAEMVRFVAAVETHASPAYRHRNVALLQVFLHTALRVAEVVSLDVAQVDLEEHLLRGVLRKRGKIFAAACNDVVVAAIEDYLRVRPRLVREPPCLALFLSDRGKRLTVRSVQQIVARYAKIAGINRRVAPHLLRHSAATALAALNTPLRVVQDICGHSSIVTTQRYVHPGAAERREAVDRLADAYRAVQGRNVEGGALDSARIH